MKMKKTLACLLSLVLVGCSNCADKYADCVQPKVTSIIYMIGDGMGLTHVTAAKLASGSPLALECARYIGLASTHSASSDVTDSAASGTALATGTKTYNGVIGMDTLRQPLTSILRSAAESGRSTGIVVTCQVTHATPAAFVANNISRNNEEAIANDFLTTRPDLFIGGGVKFFEQRADGRDISEELRAEGYRMLYSMEELASVDTLPVGVLLAPVGLPRRSAGRGDMLPQAVGEALRLLSAASERGFFLMVEGSQIDHAGHNNDAEEVVSETLDFDRAIAVAMDYADLNPGTLVVITADHETGGMALTSDTERIVDGRALPGEGNRTAAAFATKGHSGTMVPVYAYGTGAERFAGLYDNTDIPKRIAELMGL